MPFTQVEADSLLKMSKEFVDANPLEFTLTQPMAQHPVGDMNKVECERLIGDYLRWLNEDNLAAMRLLQMPTRATPADKTACAPLSTSARLQPLSRAETGQEREKT